ncbi:hypothetical protein B0D78_05310 [Pyramidobacter sp. C12-8]|nr:hypothetical protein B0D78_05310 [Pyramidobacter sp. C12-8]
MLTTFKSKRLERVCTSDKAAIRAYGVEMAGKLVQRLNEIHAADSVDFLLAHRIGRCHELHGNLEGTLAMDLVQPHRLLFTRDGRIQGIEAVKITKIENDYH